MAKNAVIATGSINLSTDTVITLPKSGKRLVLSKSYSAYQLAQIDSFLTTHTIGTKPAGVTPNLQDCADKTFYTIGKQNQINIGLLLESI